MNAPRSLELDILCKLSRKAIYPSAVQFDGQVAWVDSMFEYRA